MSLKPKNLAMIVTDAISFNVLYRGQLEHLRDSGMRLTLFCGQSPGGGEGKPAEERQPALGGLPPGPVLGPVVMMMPGLLGRGRDAIAEASRRRVSVVVLMAMSETPGTRVSAVSILRAQLPQSMP